MSMPGPSLFLALCVLRSWLLLQLRKVLLWVACHLPTGWANDNVDGHLEAT